MSEYQSSDEENAENQRSDDEEEIGQSSEDEWPNSDGSRRCIVSDPSHPHELSRQAGVKTKQKCFSCGKRSITWELAHDKNFHYSCTICQVEFHRECRKLPTKVSSCRVCYKNVDIKYGQYSCNHRDCSYVAHSKCATHYQVWDEQELEWEPEEADETEAVAPYKKVGGGLIQHFGHHEDHYLKLEKYDGSRDSGKQCQACMRYITSHDDFYSCIECAYFLHEVCANLPRKLDHLLHIHSLYLYPSYTQFYCDYGDLWCCHCTRESSGWMYICIRDECIKNSSVFHLDVNCISVPECFTHASHAEHPLFVATGTRSGILCQGCKKETFRYHLHCTICEFAICYECSTIPNEIYYKYDEHPLSLCYEESGVDHTYWCEVCEKSLDPTEWFYTSSQGCTTIHRKCLFGDIGYMKSGHTFDYKDYKVEVVGNGRSSRPKCQVCRQRCLLPLYLKLYKPDGTEVAICSFRHLYGGIK
ncbi:uncharacterized protein LOC18020349 [Eutrema salsugineum]|uniref:uncharacterized protein LOC18020349 n=1 Tax=Eutrema salsugineum TaxID=72664 RepID=UPI000CED2372|nr:uncharacterized protein LOC18020349 [Eutrema salsugineum]